MHTRILIAVALALASCASKNPPFQPTVGVPEFQAWCRTALSHPNEHDYYRQFYAAYHGDSDALRGYFAETHQQMMLRLMDPAGEEFLSWKLETLLIRLGDERFSSVLATEWPSVRSAVAGSMSSAFPWSTFPRTHAILQRSSNIDFPFMRRVGRISASSQSMKPTAPFRNKFSVLATTPCRGLSLSR
jgi:hypothetical protein